MKNGKYIAILVIGIIVIVGIVALIGINSNLAHVNDVLANEYAQREMLSNIYMDIIGSRDINVALDESALKNLITGESFSDDTINYLTTLSQFANNGSLNYVLYTEYNVNTNRLIVKLKSDTSEYTNKYTISVESGKITYEPDEISTGYDWLPAPEEEQ